MFDAVIAVDSAKKAMEFLGLKDGGGKVTNNSRATCLPPCSFQFQRPLMPGRHPFPCRLLHPARGRQRVHGLLHHLSASRRPSAAGRAVPYGPRVCFACARDDGLLFSFGSKRSPLFMAIEAKEKPLAACRRPSYGHRLTESLLHPQSRMPLCLVLLLLPP